MIGCSRWIKGASGNVFSRRNKTWWTGNLRIQIVSALLDPLSVQDQTETTWILQDCRKLLIFLFLCESRSSLRAFSSAAEYLSSESGPCELRRVETCHFKAAQREKFTSHFKIQFDSTASSLFSNFRFNMSVIAFIYEARLHSDLWSDLELTTIPSMNVLWFFPTLLASNNLRF